MSIQVQAKQENHHPAWLADFLQTYQALSVDNLHLLNNIYDKQISFQDPMHHIVGLDNLQQYFNSLYKNLTECQFTIQRVICDGEQASVYWQMRYIHPKLNKGETISVEGSSLLTAANGKVVSHRDYLDLGAMLYEQVPLLGTAVKWLKAKAVNNV